MYSTLISVALFAVPALASYAINRPELVQCETAQISWPPTKGPYNVIAVDAKEPCGEPLKDLGDITQTFFDWKVDLPAGTIVQLSVADAGDEEAWTGNITIGGGSNKSCLGGASAATPSASASGASVNRLAAPSGTPDKSSSANDDADEKQPGIVPVGAANAGSNKFLGGDSGAAPSTRQLSQSAVALGAVAALVALAL